MDMYKVNLEGFLHACRFCISILPGMMLFFYDLPLLPPKLVACQVISNPYWVIELFYRRLPSGLLPYLQCVTIGIPIMHQ